LAVPLISILLPARNTAATLGEALASLQRQTLRNWECLVLDDGSTDGTAALAESVACSDARFRVVRRRPPHGIVATLNEGASLARGELLARQDADDRSLPERLEQSLHLLRTAPAISVVACRVRLFPEQSIKPGWRAYGEWLNRLTDPAQIAGDMYVESPLPHPTVLMQRRLFESCGGYQDHGWPEDYDLWLRLHEGGHRFGKPASILYEWRHHDGRLTHRDDRYATEAFLACKLHHLEGRLRQHRHSILIWGAGRDGSRLDRALRQRGITPLAFIDIDPRKIGRSKEGRPILSPRELGGPGIRPPVALAKMWECGARHPAWHPLLLVAVGTKGARQLIRGHLHDNGWTEPDTFTCLH